MARKVHERSEEGAAGRGGAAVGVDALLAALAGRQHGVVAAWQLREAGLGRDAIRDRVDSGHLHRLHRGVYAVGHVALPPRGRWMASVLAFGPDALLSHISAGALHEVLRDARSVADVTVPATGVRRQAGIAVHSSIVLAPEDRAVIEGIPVTSLPRTLLDLAALLPPRRLRRAYEAAERLALLDMTAIHALLGRTRGHHGHGTLRRLAGYDPAPGARSRSDLEGLFLDRIRESGLPLPLVNAWVDGFEVDAYWPGARLAIELQSYEFHSHRAAFERDHRKAAALKRAGHEVLPLTYRQLTRHWPETHATLLALLARATRTT